MSDSEFDHYDYKHKARKERQGKKRDLRKKYVERLPDEIVMIPNADKAGTQERWYKGRNLANIPKIFKVLIVGPPNRGKSLTAKNLILRCHPRFDEIYLCHVDPNTEEWLDIVPEENMLQEIPPIEFFNDRTKKKLIILEDWETSKKDKNLSNLFRYTSSHLNVSLILMYQNWSSVIPLCRRLSNVFILYPQIDLNATSIIAKRVGLKPEELHEIFKLCKTPYDNICIDLTVDTPAKYRFNLFKPIKKVKMSEITESMETSF